MNYPLYPSLSSFRINVRDPDDFILDARIISSSVPGPDPIIIFRATDSTWKSHSHGETGQYLILCSWISLLSSGTSCTIVC